MKQSKISLGNVSYIFTWLMLSLFIMAFSTGCEKKSPEVKYQKLTEKAQTFINQNKFEEARISLLSAVNTKPDEPETYFKLAEVLIKLKNFRKASEAYQATLELNPKHREARLHLTTLMLLSGQPELAESNLQKLLDENAEDVEALTLRAEILKVRNDLPAAKKILDHILEKNPKNVPALATLASLSLRQGNAELAEAKFREALQSEPNNSVVRLALSDLYIRQNRGEDAQALLEGLIQDEPTNSGLRFYFGEFLLSRGLADEALKQYQETIKNAPLNLEARERLYDMYLSRGMGERAAQLTSELAKAAPEDAGVNYFRARDAEVAGDRKKALELYLKAVEGLRHFAPAFRRAGLLELASGDKRLGLEHLNQAIAIDPNDVGARLVLGQEAFSRRQFSEAELHVKKVLEKYPRQLGANILRADIALAEKDIPTARKIYQIIVAALPESPVGYLKLGMLEEQLSHVTEAVTWYRKALELDRKVFLPATRLAFLLVKNEGTDKAMEEFSALVEKSESSKPELKTILASLVLGKDKPTAEELANARRLLNEAVEKRSNLMPAYFALSQLDRQQGDIKAAIKSYEQMVKIKPDHLPTLMMLALNYEQTGDKENATQTYKKALEASPRFGPAANNLAWLLVETPGADINEAQRLAQIAKEQLPAESSVADTLGWIYYKQGSSRSALDLIQEAVEIRTAAKLPPHPEILLHLGTVKKSLGDNEGAKQALEEALQAANGNESLENSIKATMDSIQ